MKRRLLPAVALALLPVVVHAQGAAVQVGVNIHGAATLTRTGQTWFGTVAGNGARTVTVDPRSPGLDQSVAFFTAHGGANADIVVTFDATTDLCQEVSSCAEKIVFTPHVVADGCFCGAQEDITSGTTVTLNASGQYYLWLGGRIQVSANQSPGAYTGLFSMRVVHQ
jgi:hypothetical protein